MTRSSSFTLSLLLSVVACKDDGAGDGGSDTEQAGDDGTPLTPGERFCAAVAAQIQECGASTPCDDALVQDCATLAAMLNDGALDAAATCVEGGGAPLGCLAEARSGVMRTAAHDAFAASFCENCAFGVDGCETTLFDTADSDLAIAGAIILPFGDSLVDALREECTSGLTCLATFSSCAQGVIVQQGIPTETLQCVFDALIAGGPAPTGCAGGDDVADDTGSADDAPADTTDADGSSGADDDADEGTDGGADEGTSDDASSADDGGPGGDPSYPPPDPDCPPGTLGPATFNEGGATAFCAPECTNDTCPAPATGTAVGLCVISDSSYVPCATDLDCAGGETCMNAVCQLPPTHCALVCDLGEICPDGMVCTPVGACEYPL